MNKPTLIEPGVKYFLNETLKNCRNKKQVSEKININIALFALFSISIGSSSINIRSNSNSSRSRSINSSM